jgi:hypothetical protein
VPAAGMCKEHSCLKSARAHGLLEVLAADMREIGCKGSLVRCWICPTSHMVENDAM